MSMNLNCQPNERIVSSFLCVTTVILSLIILGALMLLIFDAFAIVFFRSFAAKMDPSPSKPMDDVVLGATESTSNMSFFQFVIELLKFYDLYPLLAIEEEISMTATPIGLGDSHVNGSSGYQKVGLPLPSEITDDEKVQTEEDIDNNMKVSSTITLEDKV